MYLEGWKAWLLVAVAVAGIAWGLVATVQLEHVTRLGLAWENAYYQLYSDYESLLTTYNATSTACAAALQEAGVALNSTEFVLIQASLALNYTTNQLHTVESTLNYTARVLNYTASVLGTCNATR